MTHPLSRNRISAFLLFLFLVATAGRVVGQDLKLSGFVKAENIYDTRQVLAVREGQFNLFPLAPSKETAADNLLFAAFQSRLNLAGSGTHALGADVSGVLEADFFGAVNGNVSTLRLRHAFVTFDWDRAEVLLGQYWSPLFATASYPQTVSFNTGAPFQPFARFPQIRVTWKPGAVRIMGALTQQRDAYAEIDGNKMQQQAARPAAHLVAEFGGGGGMIGAGGYVKAVRPNLDTDGFTTGAVNVYGRYAVAGLTVRGMVTAGSDLVDHLMTGGFVTTTDGRYVPLRLAAGWLDVETDTPLSAGLFSGFLANLGSRSDVVVQSANTRADDVAYIWRVSPRLVYNAGKVRLAAELEVTSALYTSSRQANYRPASVAGDRLTTNLRGVFAAYYFF